MTLNFDKLAELENPHFKGGDGSFFVKAWSDGKVKIMQGRLEPGASIGMHTHEGDCEILMMLEGCGSVLLPDGSVEEVPAGAVHYCPKGEGHSLRNLSGQPLRFFAVVPVQ